MKQRDDWHLTDTIEYDQGRADPFAAAIRATRMPMVITDPRRTDNPIVFANEAFQDLSGYGRDEIIGHNCRFLQGPDPESVIAIRTAIDAGRNIQIDILNYRKDGSTLWNALYLGPVRNAAGEVQFYFASQLDVSDRVQAQRIIREQKAIVEAEVHRRTADLEAALAAKTLLLHEVDHRVKNNLTMIGALIRLQSRSIADPAITAKLNAMLERVDALATVHRRLYQSDDISRFDIGAFTENLVSDVMGSTGRTNIEVFIDVERIEVSSNHAAALGLILNEALTNAIKHAYADGRGGKLHVTARALYGVASIVVEDDGPGLPPDGNAKDGLGRTLIGRLSGQVGATTTWNNGAVGTKIAIVFPSETHDAT